MKKYWSEQIALKKREGQGQRNHPLFFFNLFFPNFR